MVDKAVASQNELVNPGATATLASASNLPSGLWSVKYLISTNVAVEVIVRHLDPSNTILRFQQKLYLAANTTQVVPLELVLDNNDILHAYVVAAVTGKVCGGITAIKLG